MRARDPFVRSPPTRWPGPPECGRATNRGAPNSGGGVLNEVLHVLHRTGRDAWVDEQVILFELRTIREGHRLARRIVTLLRRQNLIPPASACDSGFLRAGSEKAVSPRADLQGHTLQTSPADHAAQITALRQGLLLGITKVRTYLSNTAGRGGRLNRLLLQATSDKIKDQIVTKQK